MPLSEDDPITFVVVSSRGEILRRGSAVYETALQQYNANNGEALITGEVFPDDFCDTCYFWNHDTEAFERLPEKPETGIPLFDWDNWVWVDLTPPPPDPAVVLAEARERAVLKRFDFGMVMARLRLLSVPDALLLIQKQIPPSLEYLLDAVPSSLRTDIMFRFTGADDIGRMDQILLILAGEFISDPDEREYLMDMGFGIIPWDEVEYPEL